MEHMTVDQLAEEALSLPSEDRATLADRLVESLDPADDANSRRVWGAEAMRRLDDVREGRVHAIDAEDALKRVRQAVGR
jgi:putative addiction module component (TIGR02574 family)